MDEDMEVDCCEKAEKVRHKSAKKTIFFIDK